MVLEQLLKVNFLEKHACLSIFLGFFYTIIGAITSYYFFGRDLSLPMFFITAILLVPTLLKLISLEEKVERKDGTKHFIKDHKKVFESYFFISVGIFIAYLMVMVFFSSIGWNVGDILSRQVAIFGEEVSVDKIMSFEVNKASQFLGIFLKNVEVSLVFFLLSVFFGVGSIFLILWNVSIFSSFVFTIASKLGESLAKAFGLLGAFSLYILPEITGFLLASIAGGVISKAMVTEKFGSEEFSNVIKDAALILILGLVILLVAAFLEAFVAVDLIKFIIS